MNFDIRNIPFSRRGSWLSFSYISGSFAERTGLEGLYLRTVRDCGEGKEIFRIEVLDGSAPIQFEVEASPAFMSLMSKLGRIDILFSQPETIRFKCAGVGLRLTGTSKSEFETLLPFDEKRWIFNSFGTGTTMLISPVDGVIHPDAPWSVKHVEHMVLDCTAKDDKNTFEIILHEYRSGLLEVTLPQTPFNDCVQELTLDFERFVDNLPPVPDEYSSERTLAAYINWSCLVNPEGLIRRPSMLMSKNWMTNVWSWDHCFNALAVSKRDPELAWNQYMLFFDHQDPLGAIPDSINVSKAVWNFAKPPIHGWTLMKLIDDGQISETKLNEIYEPLSRWTNWWFNCRDYDHDGIPQYNHGNDSGWDNGSVFNLNPPIESPDLVTFLILQMESLAYVAKMLGREEESKDWENRWQELLDNLLNHSVRDARLVALTSGKHEEVKNESLLLYIPLLLGDKLPKGMIDYLVEDIKNTCFITDWGVATERTTSSDYLADGYWRGPIWAPSTIFIVEGLLKVGETELAYDIVEKFSKLIRKSGFAENFDAQTGEGLRDKAYTWTASVFLLLANRLK